MPPRGHIRLRVANEPEKDVTMCKMISAIPYENTSWPCGHLSSAHDRRSYANVLGKMTVCLVCMDEEKRNE